MDDVEGASVLFYDTEPPRVTSSIGQFIHTGCYLVRDNFDKLVMETGWDRDIFRPIAYAE
jgi:hypothetical protein